MYSVVYHEGMLPGRISSVNDWSKPFPSCKDDDDEAEECCIYGGHRIEAASSFFMHYIRISSILKAFISQVKTIIDLK